MYQSIEQVRGKKLIIIDLSFYINDINNFKLRKIVNNKDELKRVKTKP